MQHSFLSVRRRVYKTIEPLIKFYFILTLPSLKDDLLFSTLFNVSKNSMHNGV